MRSGCFAIACLLLLSCAGSRGPASEDGSSLGTPRTLSLRAGDRFDVVHLERIHLDDREVFTRRTRFALEVRERTPQGSYLVRGTITRERIDDPSISVSTRLRFEWLPDGRIRAYPRAACIPEDGELELARFVRFTLGGAPIASASGRARTEAWFGEEPLDATVYARELDEEHVGLDVQAHERLAGADLGATRVDGVVRIRARFELERRSGLVGSIRRRIRGHVSAHDRRTAATPRRATLTAELETSITRARAAAGKSHRRLTEPDEADPCTRTALAEAAGVSRGLEPLRAGLHACYQAALHTAPGLSGRVVVRLSIVSPGHAALVEIAENALGDDVGRCFQDELRDLDASPGPVAGATVFAMPFVLEPGGPPAAPELSSP